MDKKSKKEMLLIDTTDERDHKPPQFKIVQKKQRRLEQTIIDEADSQESEVDVNMTMDFDK